MPRRAPEDFHSAHSHDWSNLAQEPAVRYSREKFPQVAETLEDINHIAAIDEETACIQYPNGDPENHQKVVDYMTDIAGRAQNHGLSVVSFDIDLTLDTGEETGLNEKLIDPGAIEKLQQLGHIVGTCSDRTPSDQRDLAARLNQSPHFCIPKEMLHWTARLIPGELHLHVGDSVERDQKIAEAAGWVHIWPHQFPESA